MLIILDTLFRGNAIGIVLLVSIVLMRNPRTRAKSWSVSAMGVSIIGYLLVSSTFHDQLPPVVFSIGVFGAIMMSLTFTWLVLDIFLDAPGQHWPWYLFAGATALASLASAIYPSLGLICRAMALVLHLALLWAVLTSAGDDLVEKRRQFRPVFMTAMVILGVIIIVTEMFVAPTDVPDLARLGQSAAFFGLCAGFALWSLRPDRGLWDSEAAPGRKTVKNGALPDTQTLAKLNAAIGAEFWRREGLTIGALAEELDVPEHRLRVVINRELGFRNFPSFINSFRVDAARAELSAPEKAQKTILEIAYDCGFASLGPFNKAFRAQTGTSPRDYRRGAQSTELVDS
ncbi:helix-turn-helix domain-containing protein [uncultured Roseovarius sp.]|uniref:AraC family transcriptional regulator n=1 Tax=uncultured Roseovarius sp. TaxID=293344 RepID=UPI002622583E|nr:helix-turn-helix domain-containing protein [uncultured Roseovarius sp.]